MKILFAASEVAPFVKTGGLADVAGSLPAALAGQGHDVRVILPLYQAIGDQWRSKMTFLKYFYLRLSWRSAYCGLFSLQQDGVTYYFVDNESYFKRNGLYGHYDDGERFAYFSRAVIETPEQLGWYPDIFHCNDWQTALVPIYLLEQRVRTPGLSGSKSVFTIHNIEYQGRYGKEILGDVFGLDESYYNERMLKFYDDVCLMKGAIYAADAVTTVSPTYARELGYDFYAHGLAGVIEDNRHKITGILNGIDMKGNDPARGRGIAAPYSPQDLSGKAVCKAELQQQLGLNVDASVPIVACVSRLASHKGFDLIIRAFQQMMALDLQFVLLGTGEWNYEEFFRYAQREYPGRVSSNLMYSGDLATAIYAGADLFLMPSVAEPCGLSQMIAMRYGTVPVVRLTGGLKDSVPAYQPLQQTGLGFTFGSIDAGDMLDAVRRGVYLYAEEKRAWHDLMVRDMSADFSWRQSAGEYAAIYKTLAG